MRNQVPGVREAGDQFHMLGEVMVDPQAESRHVLSTVSYEKRSFGTLAAPVQMLRKSAEV